MKRLRRNNEHKKKQQPLLNHHHGENNNTTTTTTPLTTPTNRNNQKTQSPPTVSQSLSSLSSFIVEISDDDEPQQQQQEKMDHNDSDSDSNDDDMEMMSASTSSIIDHDDDKNASSSVDTISSTQYSSSSSSGGSDISSFGHGNNFNHHHHHIQHHKNPFLPKNNKAPQKSLIFKKLPLTLSSSSTSKTNKSSNTNSTVNMSSIQSFGKTRMKTTRLIIKKPTHQKQPPPQQQIQPPPPPLTTTTTTMTTITRVPLQQPTAALFLSPPQPQPQLQQQQQPLLPPPPPTAAASAVQYPSKTVPLAPLSTTTNRRIHPGIIPSTTTTTTTTTHNDIENDKNNTNIGHHVSHTKYTSKSLVNKSTHSSTHSSNHSSNYSSTVRDDEQNKNHSSTTKKLTNTTNINMDDNDDNDDDDDVHVMRASKKQKTEQHDVHASFMNEYPFHHIQQKYHRFRVQSIESYSHVKVLHVVHPLDFSTSTTTTTTTAAAANTTTTTMATSSDGDSLLLLHEQQQQQQPSQSPPPPVIVVKQVHLKREWRDTIVNIGDYIHVVGSFSTTTVVNPIGNTINTTTTITHNNNINTNNNINNNTNNSEIMMIDSVQFPHHMIIVNPDYLLSATTISESSKCLRVAFFRELYMNQYMGHSILIPSTINHHHNTNNINNNNNSSVRVVGKQQQEQQLFSSTNYAALLGTLSHQVFQTAVHQYMNLGNEQAFSNAHLTQYSMSAIREHLLLVHSLHRNEYDVLIDLKYYFASFKQFKDMFIGLVPQSMNTTTTTTAAAAVSDASSSSSLVSWNNHQTSRVKMMHCHDLEEVIWSPMNGLKGIIDMTVQIRNTAVSSHHNPPSSIFYQNYHYQKNHQTSPNNNNNAANQSESVVDMCIPIELKSGRMKRLDHEAQLLLYLQMLSDKYGISNNSTDGRAQLLFDRGMLYYFKSSKPSQSNNKNNAAAVPTTTVNQTTNRKYMPRTHFHLNVNNNHNNSNNNNSDGISGTNNREHGTVLGIMRKQELLRQLIRNRNMVASSLMNTVVFDYNRMQKELHVEQQNEKKLYQTSLQTQREGYGGTKNHDTSSIELFSNNAFSSQKHKPQLLVNHDGDDREMENLYGVSPLSETANVNDIEETHDLYFDLIPKPPPMKRDAYTCNYCYEKRNCLLYHAAVERGNEESSGIPAIFRSTVAMDMTDRHKSFLDKWLKLLDLESLEMNHFRKEIWTMTGPERELHGRCASCMVLVSSPNGHQVEMHAQSSKQQQQDQSSCSSGNDPMIYTFEKYKHAPEYDLEQLHMTVGDYVTISSEEGHLSLSSGTIMEINSRRIVIRAKRMVRIPRLSNHQSSHPIAAKYPDLYRIDMDEYGGRMNQQRGYLMSLFSSVILDHNEGSDTNNNHLGRPVLAHRRIVELIVDLKEPLFDRTEPRQSFIDSQPAFESFTRAPWWGDRLNSDQQNAILNVLRANDYSLILGMPGTGKTSTIVYLLMVLISLGKTVLLTSYTHTAVDNILLKCVEMGLGSEIVRLGKSSSVNTQLHPYVLNNMVSPTRHTPINSDTIEYGSRVDELILKLANKRIVACTCLGVSEIALLGAQFNTKRFDYCIIDEAGQVTQTVALGPILASDKFVLVGDHHQLEPLVVNHKARAMGMGVSLFQRLYRVVQSSELCRPYMSYLRYQYRMNKQVLQLCNKIVYDNKLMCGNQFVANAVMDYPNWSRTEALYSNKTSNNWLLNHVIHAQKSVVFVNTDPHGQEDTVGFKLVNKFEQILIGRIVQLMINELGTDPSSIGIVTPYRLQVYHLKNMLQGVVGSSIAKQIEVYTVDRFQGKDKECMIMSFVRSNNDRLVDDLVTDKKRMNVAMTRAKTKFICVGSYRTHKKYENIGHFLQIMKRKQWVIDIDESLALEIRAMHPLQQQKPHKDTNDRCVNENEESKQEMKEGPRIVSKSAKNESSTVPSNLYKLGSSSPVIIFTPPASQSLPNEQQQVKQQGNNDTCTGSADVITSIKPSASKILQRMNKRNRGESSTTANIPFTNHQPLIVNRHSNNPFARSINNSKSNTVHTDDTNKKDLFDIFS